MIETDILIVGAGPAGSTLARYLASANIDTLLVQRNFNFRKPCGGGLRHDAFSEFDINTQLIKQSVEHIVLVYKDRRIRVDLGSTPVDIVDRVEFDTSLRHSAQEAGARVLEATFMDVEVFNSYIVAKLKQDDEVISVKARYLVGADGVNSKVRKIINKDKVDANLTTYADITECAYDDCEFHFGSEIADRYYAWAFPHADGSNIGTLSEDKESMNAFYKHLELEPTSKSFGYKIPHFKNPIFYQDRVFFVGDSASQVLPFTYEGIYYAMSSAKILSELIINDASPYDYEKKWNKKYLKKFNTLARLQNIFLKNNFMIAAMMRLFQNKMIQREMIQLWLGQRELKIDMIFFIKVMKKIIGR